MSGLTGQKCFFFCSGRVVPVDSNQVCMCLPRCNDSEPLGSHMLDVLEHKDPVLHAFQITSSDVLQP